MTGTKLNFLPVSSLYKICTRPLQDTLYQARSVQSVLIPKYLSAGSTRPNRSVQNIYWPCTKFTSLAGLHILDKAIGLLYFRNTRSMSGQQIYNSKRISCKIGFWPTPSSRQYNGSSLRVLLLLSWTRAHMIDYRPLYTASET